MLLRRLFSTTLLELPKQAAVVPKITEIAQPVYNIDVDLDESVDESIDYHFDCSQNNPQSADESENDVLEVLPKVISKKQDYEVQGQIAVAKSDGCAPLPKGRASSDIFNYLLERDGQNRSLSNTYITLFNFHKTDFADKLLNRNVGKVIIAESAMHYARDAKKFARLKVKENFHNLEAVRADQAVLFGLGRKRSQKAHEKLLANSDCGSFALKTVSMEDVEHSPLSWCVNAPVLVATFPTPAQQEAVLNTLRKSLLTHLCKLTPKKETIYDFGPVEWITFLSASNIGHLLCSSDPLLSFFSHSHMRQSALMHKLFDISSLSSTLPPRIEHLKEFKPSQFDPPIPPARPIAHDKKLKEVNILNGRYYGTNVRPKRSINIGGFYVGSDELPSSDLLKYAWFSYSVGKNAAGKKVQDVIGSMCPESGPEAARLLGKSEKIGIIPSEDLDAAFLKVKSEIRVSDEWINKEALLNI